MRDMKRRLNPRLWYADVKINGRRRRHECIEWTEKPIMIECAARWGSPITSVISDPECSDVDRRIMTQDAI